MDFFSQQERIQTLSKRLSVLFVIAIVGVVSILNLGVYWIIKAHYPHLPFETLFKINLAFSCLVILTIGLAAWIRFKQFSDGGISIGLELGGRIIDPSTEDLDERRLLNIVEEMALASNLPMVEVFILENPKINAFAAGLNPSDAVIGVTSGALKLLSREELQGIIGHEMGHIKNGDTRLGLKILSSIYGLSVVSIIGRACLQLVSRSKGRSKKNLPIIIVVGLLFWIAGLIGVFFARLIQSAISRQREYLADASSVQFTRNPEGLSNALKKIGGLVEKWISSDPVKFEHRHLFFVNSDSFFATHPPLADRIKAIDPHFDGTFEAFIDPKVEEEKQKKFENNADKLSPLLNILPEPVINLCNDPLSSYQLLISLMMKDDKSQKHPAFIENLSASDALKAIKLSLPSLRKLSVQQYGTLMTELKTLSERDHRLTLYEYVIIKMVKDSKPDPKRMSISHFYQFKPVIKELQLLFSCVCYSAVQGKKDAELLLTTASIQLGVMLNLEPPEKCKVSELDTALNKLVLLTPKLKNQIIDTVQLITKTDEKLTESEEMMIELIRFSLC